MLYDAILYILSHAGSKTDHVVIINLSYGPTTGPHNGLAELETLLTTFVEKYDGNNGKLKLEIVLAAGNSYLLRGSRCFLQEQSVSLTMSNGAGAFLPTTPLCASPKCG